MFGCGGGSGIDVYAGGRLRFIVSSNMTRTGAATIAATPLSPTGEAPAHRELCRSRGAVDPTVLAAKQFAAPAPAASARSDQPLRRTMFPETRLPCGRHGGPGSRVLLRSNVT